MGLLLHVICGVFLSADLAVESGQAEIVYRFTSLHYDWPDDNAKVEAVSKGEYTARNNIITGIKVYRDDVFVTVPRWKPGVPATLSELVSKNGSGTVLQPYPGWSMNAVGNCSALQYVQSMEVDPNTGYMWIIDTGRINTNAFPEQPQNVCPPKLVILDIDTKQVVRVFIFPSNVVSPTSNFMNDIVLDYVGGEAKFAYISDTKDAKIYAYDYERNTAYFFQHDSMKAQPLIHGVQDGLVSAPVDGIAMSYDFKYLYYSTLSSRQLYAVPTSVMRHENTHFASALFNVGQKHGGSDGMAYGQMSLFYAALEENAVYKASTGPNGVVSMNHQQKLASDNDTMAWIDTFAWNGTELWFTANKLPQFFSGRMNFSGNDTNMVIWKMNVGEMGYLDKARLRTASDPSVVG